MAIPDVRPTVLTPPSASPVIPIPGNIAAATAAPPIERSQPALPVQESRLPTKGPARTAPAPDPAPAVVGNSSTTIANIGDPRSIETGALPSVGTEPELPGSRILSPEATEALLQAAERAQARSDLVKLEFASRTYNERRQSGQPVFDLRQDWKVLERARDTLSSSEAAAAKSVGFDANAYINDTTKTIVVAVAGSDDLRRDILQAGFWDALVRSQMPQHYYLAKTYTRSVIRRFQAQGYTTECVGHSLGGGACAYVASELGIRAIVVNPISAGGLADGARPLINNYVVGREIAPIVYGALGKGLTGDTLRLGNSRSQAPALAQAKFGALAGPVLVVKTLSGMLRGHRVENALDLIAAHGGIERPR